MITLLARWALRGLTGPTSIDDEDIQGQPAIVTEEISLAGPGEISYEQGAPKCALPHVASIPGRFRPATKG